MAKVTSHGGCWAVGRRCRNQRSPGESSANHARPTGRGHSIDRSATAPLTAADEAVKMDELLQRQRQQQQQQPQQQP